MFTTAPATWMADHLRQRTAINDLHFTYRQLGKRLPSLAQRAPESLGALLSDQHARDAEILQCLVAQASRIGQLPRPQACEAPRAVIDNLHLAAVGKLNSAIRMLAIIKALQGVRALTAQGWNQLLLALPPSTMPEFRTEALNAQQQVIQQYHDLSELARRLRAN
jgi:hypothetical protein